MPVRSSDRMVRRWIDRTLAFPPMNVDRITAHIKELDLSRSWIAENLGFEQATVDGWFDDSGTASPVSVDVEMVLRVTDGKEAPTPFSLPLERYLACRVKAKDSGVELGDWFADVIRAELDRECEATKHLG